MSSLNYRTPEAFLPNCARRCPGQGRRLAASECLGTGRVPSRSPWLSSGRTGPMGPPSMSIKCSDSQDMKEYGVRFRFLASGQHGEILPRLYCLRRQPARWPALGTPPRHYASKE